MRRRHLNACGLPGRNAAALLLVLAQLGASALPVADALLESRESGEVAHVETPESECATHHDNLCQVVRSLSVHRGSRARGFVPGSEPLVVASIAPHGTDVRRGIARTGPVGSRAPPLG